LIVERQMPVLLASARTGGASGARLLLLAVLALAALWFIFEFFKREIGGLGGGSEKNIVGVLVLVAAIVVGILLARGANPGPHAHPRYDSTTPATTQVQRHRTPTG
jgi:hypothetical protein